MEPSVVSFAKSRFVLSPSKWHIATRLIPGNFSTRNSSDVLFDIAAEERAWVWVEFLRISFRRVFRRVFRRRVFGRTPKVFFWGEHSIKGFGIRSERCHHFLFTWRFCKRVAKKAVRETDGVISFFGKHFVGDRKGDLWGICNCASGGDCRVCGEGETVRVLTSRLLFFQF